MAHGSINDDVDSVINKTGDLKTSLENNRTKYQSYQRDKKFNNASDLVKILSELRSLKKQIGTPEKTWKKVLEENGKKDRQAREEERREHKRDLQTILNDPEASKAERDHARKQLGLLQTQENILKKTHDFLTTKLPNELKTTAKEQSKYLSSLNTRLQGANKSYSSILQLINKNIGINAYVKQSKVFEKLNDYVSQGIAYNVEQRAFLGTVSEKIATTFEANNAALLQIVKIQQADSTKARLGMEASLTSFFNSQFKDSSYLNSLSDSVSSAILGTSSQLSRNGSVEFEYAVQKWLGSMSSVGVSESTIQSLAQGINALGTGDINTLSGNSGLQNLLVMAANKAGLNYSKLLSEGMNANTTSSLLSGMISYLQGISGIQNHVVKTQYANLFGMTISDLTALLNLSTDHLKSIATNMYSYSELIDNTTRALNQLSSRTSVGEMAENIYDNIMTNSARLITSNIGTYLTFLAADTVGTTLNELLGETKVSPMGVGTSFSAGDKIKAAVSSGFVGLGLLNGLMANHVYGLNANDENWDATKTVGIYERGLNATLADLTTGRGTSQIIYVGNNNESDFYKSTLISADEQLEQVSGQSKSVETTQEVSKIADLTRDSIDPNVRAIRDILESWNIMGLKIKMF